MARSRKWCPRCQDHHDLSEFNRSARAADGLQGVCRRCQRLYFREWAERNRQRNEARWALEDAAAVAEE